MIKNYFDTDPDKTISFVLKKAGEKKHSNFIIVNTIPKSFVDINNLALSMKSEEEKIRNFIQTIPKQTNESETDTLIKSGTRLILTKDDIIFDFVNALESIKNSIENQKIASLPQKKINTLMIHHPISYAKSMLSKKKISILPVIDDNSNIIGEVRPIDLLLSYSKEKIHHKTNDINQIKVLNIANKNPITIDMNLSIKSAIDTMIKKQLPSIIVSKNKTVLHSIITYKDILKIYKHAKSSHSEKNKNIEFTKTDGLYPDEIEALNKYFKRIMNKISKISNYNLLKITTKELGAKELSGHKKKIEINIRLSSENNILKMKKEISQEQKGEWNPVRIIKKSLKSLTESVKKE